MEKETARESNSDISDRVSLCALCALCAGDDSCASARFHERGGRWVSFCELDREGMDGRRSGVGFCLDVFSLAVRGGLGITGIVTGAVKMGIGMIVEVGGADVWMLVEACGTVLVRGGLGMIDVITGVLKIGVGVLGVVGRGVCKGGSLWWAVFCRAKFLLWRAREAGQTALCSSREPLGGVGESTSRPIRSPIDFW